MPQKKDTRNKFCKTLIYAHELSRITGWVEAYPNLETGGDLFGYCTHTGAPVVLFALGPGPNSRHGVHSFYQDREYLIYAGKILQKEYGVQHLGEWHSHHQLSLKIPSSGDKITVHRALKQYGFDRFVLYIANLEYHAERGFTCKSTVEINSYQFTQNQSGYETGRWVVLPGSSPIRLALRSKYDAFPFMQDPRLSTAWSVAQTTLAGHQIITPKESEGHLWYASKQGMAYLRILDKKMRRIFSACRLLRDGSGNLCIAFTKNDDQWRVMLPKDFPDSAPTICINDNPSVTLSAWQTPAQLTKSITAHITQFYKETPNHDHQDAGPSPGSGKRNPEEVLSKV